MLFLVEADTDAMIADHEQQMADMETDFTGTIAELCDVDLMEGSHTCTYSSLSCICD